VEREQLRKAYQYAVSALGPSSPPMEKFRLLRLYGSGLNVRAGLLCWCVLGLCNLDCARALVRVCLTTTIFRLLGGAEKAQLLPLAFFCRAYGSGPLADAHHAWSTPPGDAWR